MNKEKNFHVSIPVYENGRAAEDSADHLKKFAVGAAVTIALVSLGLLTTRDPSWPFFAMAGITGYISAHQLLSASRN